MKNKIARLLKTEMTDLPLPALAQLVRAGGRNKDTILAHITPEEAKVLKDRGGSGRTNPNTGLPEFDVMGGDFYGGDDFGGGGYTAPSGGGYTGGFEPDIGGGYQSAPATYAPTPDAIAYSGPYGASVGPDPSAFYAPPITPAGTAPTAEGTGLARQLAQEAYYGGPSYGGYPEMPTEPSAYEQVRQFITRNKDWLPSALKLGAGAVGTIPALGQIGRARRGAAKVAAQQQQLGYPYQTSGQQMTSAAQRGELTPERQQAFQAAQAQFAQQQAQSGFVGSQAYAVQLQDFRNRLLGDQYRAGIALQNIGDQYVRQGLQASLNADTQVQKSISDFYTALGSNLQAAMA